MNFSFFKLNIIRYYKTHIRIKFVFFLLFFFPSVFSFGQEEQDKNSLFNSTLFFTEINPEHPSGVFSLDIPFYFSTAENDSRELSFGYSMGNNWNPQVSIYYPQGMTDFQNNVTKKIPIEKRLHYFLNEKIITKKKMYQSDAVLEHLHITYLRKKRKNSFVFNMNIHWLSGGKAPVNYFVSDNFLEWFHSNFAIEDNFGRKQFPYNESFFEFKDENGNDYSKGRGDVFLTVSDLHYYRNLFEKKTFNSQFCVQASGHLSIPLNSFHAFLIPGISLGLRYDFLLGLRNSFTLAFEGAETFPCFMEMGSDMHFIDRKYREQINLYFGWNRLIKKDCYFNFGVLNNYQGSLIKGGSDYGKLGVGYLMEGDSWKGNVIPGRFPCNKFSYKAINKPSCKTFFIIGYRKVKGNSFRLYVGEDFFCFNNAPDFQIGFQYSFPIDRKD